MNSVNMIKANSSVAQYKKVVVVVFDNMLVDLFHSNNKHIERRYKHQINIKVMSA